LAVWLRNKYRNFIVARRLAARLRNKYRNFIVVRRLAVWLRNKYRSFLKPYVRRPAGFPRRCGSFWVAQR
jgi:hypothetical protein